MDPKFLIVMPCYNAESTIVRAIESIINQSYSNWELVIVDDASTDKSYKIALEYTKQHSNITLLKNHTNQGCYYSRNRGLFYNKENTWDYFTVHDADDESSFDRLETYSQYIKTQPQLDYIFSAGEGDRWISHNCLSFISKSKWVGPAFISKRIFNTIGYFNHDTKFGADAEYEYRTHNMFAFLYNVKTHLEDTAWRKKLFFKYKVYGNLKNKYNYTYKLYPTLSNLTLKYPHEEREKFADNWPNKYKTSKDLNIKFTPRKEDL